MLFRLGEIAVLTKCKCLISFTSQCTSLKHKQTHGSPGLVIVTILCYTVIAISNKSIDKPRNNLCCIKKGLEDVVKQNLDDREDVHLVQAKRLCSISSIQTKFLEVMIYIISEHCRKSLVSVFPCRRKVEPFHEKRRPKHFSI